MQNAETVESENLFTRPCPLLRFALITAFALIAHSALSGGLPLNPDVTQATIATTICQPGRTRKVRPYVGAMKSIKVEMLAAIGEPIERRNQYELDHKVPLAPERLPIT
jgi:hypothetical protein